MLALVVVSIALADPTHAQIDAAAWSHVTTARHAELGEVQIDKAEVAGISCFRGAARVQGVSPSALLETAIDVEGAVRWSKAGLTDGRVLSRTGDRVTYFQFLDVPNWTLASDRFWFLEGQVERRGASRSFRWDRLTDDGSHAAERAQVEAAHPDAVEPPVNMGAWHFDVAGDAVDIRYVICSDTGGSMPRMLQNAATRRTLPDTVGDVVRQARRIEG